MSRHSRRHETQTEIARVLARLMAESRDCQSQSDLARRSGVSQSSVGRILRDETSPHANTLAFIADALGIKLSKFYALVEGEKPLHCLKLELIP
jgi:transcriptional regulator with XRE-family HTH domain